MVVKNNNVKLFFLLFFLTCLTIPSLYASKYIIITNNNFNLSNITFWNQSTNKLGQNMLFPYDTLTCVGIGTDSCSQMLDVNGAISLRSTVVGVPFSNTLWNYMGNLIWDGNGLTVQGWCPSGQVVMNTTTYGVDCVSLPMSMNNYTTSISFSFSGSKNGTKTLTLSRQGGSSLNTSFNESDPYFMNSQAYYVTSTLMNSWTTAYGHSLAQDALTGLIKGNGGGGYQGVWDNSTNTYLLMKYVYGFMNSPLNSSGTTTNINTSFIPLLGNQFTLGESSHVWQSIYGNNIYASSDLYESGLTLSSQYLKLVGGTMGGVIHTNVSVDFTSNGTVETYANGCSQIANSSGLYFVC